MKASVIPRCEVIARIIPPHFTEQSDKVVNGLIEKNVIAKVDVPPPWVSPAFFRVRLVMDYTKLNKFVDRPIHSFPSTRDIMQSIPNGQHFFAKLDAVHGCFQLGLDDKGSFVTTFPLPQEWFWYLRVPMGLNASPDKWCRHLDVMIEGLPWAINIVDDNIIWASTTESKQCWTGAMPLGAAAYQLGNTSSRTITEVKQR